MDFILCILLSLRFNIFLTFVIYYFAPESWTLLTWFYIFILTHVWDIVSTYNFVYIYGLGWETEENILIQFFARHTNYHWAVFFQTLVVCGSIVLFCILWPWPELSKYVFIFFSILMFNAGIFNFLSPLYDKELCDEGCDCQHIYSTKDPQ